MVIIVYVLYLICLIYYAHIIKNEKVWKSNYVNN